MATVVSLCESDPSAAEGLLRSWVTVLRAGIGDHFSRAVLVVMQEMT